MILRLPDLLLAPAVLYTPRRGVSVRRTCETILTQALQKAVDISVCEETSHWQGFLP
jgi:hypothetical protein